MNVPNPYTLRMNDYPGRLFPWSEPRAELPVLKAALSGRPRVFAELGSGSGGHMLRRAADDREAMWVGFEIRFKRAVRTLEKAVESGLPNVHVVRTDGRQLEDFFEPNSVEGLYVNFPDPWLKLRRRKHRMLNADVIQSASLILRDRGFMAVKTDHQDYFTDFLESLIEWKGREGIRGTFEIEEESRDLHQSEFREQNVITEFERLFLSQGLPICYLKLRFRAEKQERKNSEIERSSNQGAMVNL